MTADSYTTDTHIHRNGDGSFEVTAGNGRHHFPDADTAMAYHATMIRRIAAIEQAAHKAAQEKAAKNGEAGQ